MNYSKHDYNPGDILYAKDLNEMDDQIKENDSRHDIESLESLKTIIDMIFGGEIHDQSGNVITYEAIKSLIEELMKNNRQTYGAYPKQVPVSQEDGTWAWEDLSNKFKGNTLKIGGDLVVGDEVLYISDNTIDYAVNNVANYIIGLIDYAGKHNIPVATNKTLGGVKAKPSTPSDTQEVHITPEGLLVTEPGSGGGGKPGNFPFYNALDYGVSASNADNTDAINSVLNAAYESGGGTVVLPAGIIKTFPFDMCSKVSVIGQGMFATTLSFLGTSQSGRPSAVFFPENAIGCEFAHLALYGNWTAQNGIDCASIGHSGGFGENDYSDALFSNPTDFIKYKASHLHHLFIAKFGYQVDYLMPANTTIGWGIYHHEQSNYCFDMSNIWVYACQNGIKCMGTDSSLTNSYVEHCHFQGLWLQGGNSKYNNLKVIWNGLKWDGSGELFAIDMHEDTQYLSIMNLECQDNYCNDIRLKGIGHEIHCFADGSRDVRKNYKIKCENLRGSILDVRLTNYVGHESDNYKATYDFVMANCHHNKVNAIIMPNVAKNQGTVDNVNGDTNIIRM